MNCQMWGVHYYLIIIFQEELSSVRVSYLPRIKQKWKNNKTVHGLLEMAATTWF